MACSSAARYVSNPAVHFHRPTRGSAHAFDEEVTVGVEHTKLGCIGVLTVGKRQRGVVDLTVAGVAVASTFDLSDVEPTDRAASEP